MHKSTSLRWQVGRPESGLIERLGGSLTGG